MKLEDYTNQRVKVADIYGTIYIGIVELYTQPNDNDGVEAIAISCDGHGIWLDGNEIKSIELA